MRGGDIRVGHDGEEEEERRGWAGEVGLENFDGVEEEKKVSCEIAKEFLLSVEVGASEPKKSDNLQDGTLRDQSRRGELRAKMSVFLFPRG